MLCLQKVISSVFRKVLCMNPTPDVLSTSRNTLVNQRVIVSSTHMQIGQGWVHVSKPTALQMSRCYKKFKPASLKQSETSAVIIMLMIMRSPLAE